MNNSNRDPSLADATAGAFGMGMKMGEMAVASAVVIGARMMLIGAAMRNPLAGDYRELGRMVPEKMSALTQSGMVLIDQMGAAQRDVVAQMTDSETLMSGGIPTPVAWMKLMADAGQRGARAMLWPFTTGDAAMAPVHRTVTSNAKRLQTGRRKRG